MSIFNADYRGIPIKSDSRIHDAVIDILREKLSNNSKQISILDVAAGKGAISQRVIDSFRNIVMDCNDLESGVMAKGIRNSFSLNLNEDFNFNKKYDIILAVEIIEHLENPFHFIRYLDSHLKSNGLILLTTPSIDSFFDRLWFLLKGYHFYFGSKGIINSGGHITMCPQWLLSHIAAKHNLDLIVAPKSISAMNLLGWRGRLMLRALSPLRIILQNAHESTSTICIFQKRN
jgi:hypothetical protein